jgi:hypothetical protein
MPQEQPQFIEPGDVDPATVQLPRFITFATPPTVEQWARLEAIWEEQEGQTELSHRQDLPDDN